MKLLILIARLFVAATFLFSGFVKLVDPLGSAYKFQEYFGSDVLNLEFLIFLQKSILNTIRKGVLTHSKLTQNVENHYLRLFD